MSARRAAFERIESALGDSVRRVGGVGGVDLGFRPDPGVDRWIPLKVQVPWTTKKNRKGQKVCELASRGRCTSCLDL